MGYYYLSFSDDDGPKGACIVEAADEATALTKSHVLGINPGGEVLMVPFEPDALSMPVATVENKFYTPAQLVVLFGPIQRVRL